MIIPSVPSNRVPIASNDGLVTEPWRIYFDQLSNQLQGNLLTTYEGELTTAVIAAIPSGQRNGKFIFDTDTATLKFGFNDSFSTVTTT